MGGPPDTLTLHTHIIALRSIPTSLPDRMCRNSQLGAFSTSSLSGNRTHTNLYRWESPPSTSAQFSVPDNWKSGQIWVRIFFLLPNSLSVGVRLHFLADLRARACARLFFVGFQGRRNCNFSSNAGTNGCLDGGCNGGLQCDPHTGTVRPFPITFT